MELLYFFTIMKNVFCVSYLVMKFRFSLPLTAKRYTWIGTAHNSMGLIHDIINLIHRCYPYGYF